MMDAATLASQRAFTGDPQQDEPSSDYDRVIDIMTDAVQKISKKGITKADFLPALVDFTAAVALAMRGEECLREIITRMEGRIDDWRAGTFPATD
jgi:hypothetical protein